MKIVRIDGGLGNQMFCYAFAVALREASKEEILLDTHRYKFFPNHVGYELGNLCNLSMKEASRRQLWSVTNVAESALMSRLFYYLPRRKSEIVEDFVKCYPSIIQEHKDGYYIGNWQWYKYFDSYRPQVLHELSFINPLDNRNNMLYRQLRAEDNSVSLHIRRGDYLKDDKFCGICDVEYYLKAIERARAVIDGDIHFVIFSNDIPWCMEHIIPLLSPSVVSVVDWNTGKDSNIDMRLMSACRINIIANSSFSWWAAYTNPRKDKYVIAPKTWIHLPLTYRIQCDEWECL